MQTPLEPASMRKSMQRRWLTRSSSPRSSNVVGATGKTPLNRAAGAITLLLPGHVRSVFGLHASELKSLPDTVTRAGIVDRPPYAFGCRGHVDVMDAVGTKRVDDGVHHRRQGSRATGLAAALDAEDVGRRRYRMAVLME